jgi:hypothetical protein
MADLGYLGHVWNFAKETKKIVRFFPLNNTMLKIKTFGKLQGLKFVTDFWRLKDADDYNHFAGPSSSFLESRV